MQPKEQQTTRKDVMGLAIFIVVAGLVFAIFTDTVEIVYRFWIALLVVASFFAGMVGKDRHIGFGNVFFISLLLSPLVGFIFAFTSKSLKEEAESNKIKDIAYTSSMADHLLKLNELRKEGILTEEEFQAQKSKLLNN